MQPKANVSFIFPYRWLTEDRAFLEENLRRQFIKDWGEDHLYEVEGIPAYRVNIIYRYKEPVKIDLTKLQIQKAFKKYFPIAKCLSVNVEFAQHKSKTMLPVIDFQMYF